MGAQLNLSQLPKPFSSSRSRCHGLAWYPQSAHRGLPPLPSPRDSVTFCTSFKGKPGEFLSLSLHPSCLERDSIKHSQWMGRVFKDFTLFSESIHFPPIAPGLMEAKDNPRVFIGNSLELSAIVFVVFFFFLNLILLLTAFGYFFRGLTISYYRSPLCFSKTCGDIVFKNNYFVIDHNMHKTVQKYFVMY